MTRTMPFKVMTRYFRDAERAVGARSFWARRALYSLFGLCCLSYGSAGHTQGDDGPDYSYYIVTAVPGKSLQSILNAASPIHRDGRVFYAHTDWHVQWNIWWSIEPEGPCKITKVMTKVTATIILPRLINATPTQQDRFNALLSGLNVHELGHYDFAKQAATEIEAGVLSMPEMDTCAALEVAANDLGNRTLSEYKMRESNYDLETDHGRSQGAWLD
jgi:predicted secreted Zn-dependent protease